MRGGGTERGRGDREGEMGQRGREGTVQGERYTETGGEGTPGSGDILRTGPKAQDLYLMEDPWIRRSQMDRSPAFYVHI